MPWPGPKHWLHPLLCVTLQCSHQRTALTDTGASLRRGRNCPLPWRSSRTGRLSDPRGKREAVESPVPWEAVQAVCEGGDGRHVSADERTLAEVKGVTRLPLTAGSTQPTHPGLQQLWLVVTVSRYKGSLGCRLIRPDLRHLPPTQAGGFLTPEQ